MVRAFLTRRAGRRYRRSLRPDSPLGAAVLLIIVAVAAWRFYHERSQPEAPASLAEDVYSVESVVDGDTLWLVNHAKIRLIGADTPETVMPNHPVEPWGAGATAFTKEFVAGGQVRLQLDRERIDSFGRRLAYVWVDDRMLNEELIRAGLARVRTEFHYSQTMKTRFLRAQDEARAARRGIWSASAKPNGLRPPIAG